MEGSIKIFSGEPNEVERQINDHIRYLKYRKRIIATPIHTSQEALKSIPQLYIPQRIQVVVSFEQRETTTEENVQIDHYLEIDEVIKDKTSDGVRIRKNLEDETIMFWFYDEYLDIKKLFEKYYDYYNKLHVIVKYPNFLESSEYFDKIMSKCDYDKGKFYKFMSECADCIEELGGW